MVLDPDDVQARSEALVGEVLGGRYRLDAVLGIGAMGAVFAAFHTGLERQVAVKLLHKDLMASEEMRARFSREAAAISKLDHPSCVRVSDFGSDGDHQYLVMELLQGTPLSNEVGEPMPTRRAMEIVDEVLAGLEHAHGHGLIHRDIKPDNVFLANEDGGKTRAKLLDFGIVKLQEPADGRQLTQVGMIFGTPHFMSPEQATGGETDTRTDLYATGIVLYIMLAGRLPFDSDDPVKVLRQQIRDEPPPLPETVPGPLQQLVATLMAKKPEDRPASATAAREALAAVREELEPKPKPEPKPVEIPAPPAAPPVVPAQGASAHPPMVLPSSAPAAWRPSRTQWIAGGVGVLALVVMVALAMGGDDDEGAAEQGSSGDQAAAAREGLGALLGGKAKADDGETKGKGKAAGDGEQPTPSTDDEIPASERALQASLASVDALIEARQYESARITMGPLLQAHEGEAGLHWRMAKVLTALDGVDNRAAALRSYAAAIEADAALLDDEALMAEITALMDDPKLREPAVELALTRLGTRADDTLLEWLNVQAKPLGYGTRHRIITHLKGHERGGEINEPLQRALDLWQAREAEDPCAAFSGALQQALRDPDSFLVGTLHGVPVPTAAPAGPDVPEPPACPGATEALEQARAKHDAMFAGIDPVVPKAYRKRPAASSSSSRKRGR